MRTCVRPHSKVDSRKVWVAPGHETASGARCGSARCSGRASSSACGSELVMSPVRKSTTRPCPSPTPNSVRRRSPASSAPTSWSRNACSAMRACSRCTAPRASSYSAAAASSTSVISPTRSGEATDRPRGESAGVAPRGVSRTSTRGGETYCDQSCGTKSVVQAVGSSTQRRRRPAWPSSMRVIETSTARSRASRPSAAMSSARPGGDALADEGPAAGGPR